MALLIRAVRKEPDFLSYKVTDKMVNENVQLMEIFSNNRRGIYNVAIF